MTSEQVRLSGAALLLALSIGGCAGHGPAADLPGPQRELPMQAWAVAPLRNESGSLRASGLLLADHLARQFENADGIDVLAVNRVITAMQALEMEAVRTPVDAATLLRTLDADVLVVGTITVFDPYDPPKLGLAVELYRGPRRWPVSGLIDVRLLSRSATDRHSWLGPPTGWDRPVTAVSGYYDAADPITRERLRWYGQHRGPTHGPRHGWRLYRINMDLYSEFVSHEVSSRLLRAEAQRPGPPELVAEGPDGPDS